MQLTLPETRLHSFSTVICLLCMKVARVIAAYIVSPLAGAIYWVVLNWLLNHRDPELLRDPLAIIGILLLFAMIGYVAEGLLGTLLLCWFRRRGYSSLSSFLWGGFAIGLIVWLYPLLVFFPVLRERSLLYNLTSVLIGAVVPALLSTTVFWFIAGRQITNRWTRAEPAGLSSTTSV